MKKVLVILCVVAASVALTEGYVIVKTEAQVRTWESRVESATYLEGVSADILKAQDYSERLFESVQTLARENGILCERDKKAQSYIVSLEEENARLKSVVAESVEKMQTMLDSENALKEDIDRLNYKIEVLEKALKLIPTPADPDATPINDPNC